MQSLFHPQAKHLTPLLGLIVLILSVTVMGGWLLHLPRIVQILPSQVPMQFNTALCFGLLGATLLTLSQTKKYIPRTFSILAFILSATTLTQYITRIDLGIDELFITHYITVLTPNPGRMAPHTALSFIILSIVVLLKLGNLNQVVKPWILISLTSATFAIAVIALFGYITGLIPAFGWGSGTTMALHTSVGFLLLSLALLSEEWRGIHSYREFREAIIASVIPIALIASVIFSFAMIVERQTAYKKILDANASILRLAINQRIIGVTNNIVRISGMWPQLNDDREKQWRRYTSLLHQDLHVFHSIEWVDKSMRIRWAEPETSANEYVGINIGNNVEVHNILLEAREKGTRFSEKIYMEPSGSSVLLVNPVFINSEFDGWMLARIDMNLLLESFTPLMMELGIAAQLQQRTGLILTQSGEMNSQYHAQKILQVPGQAWQLIVSPLDNFFTIHATPLTSVTAGMMLISIALLLLLIYLLLTGRQNTIELEKLHNKLQSAFHAMMDGIVIISEKGEIEDTNETAAHLFGYKNKGLIGSNINQLIPDTTQDSDNQSDGKTFILGDKNIVGQPRIFRAIKKDGEIFPVELKISEATVDGQRFFTGVIRDLSEKIATEEKLAERDSLINAAIRSSPVSIAIADRLGSFVDVNDALCAWLGYTREELIGLSFTNILAANERADAERNYHSLITNQTTSTRREKFYRRKNGEHVWGLLCASQITNASGEVTHIAAQILDIQEEKKLRQELQTQNRELVAINVELDQFAYIASHDLKEPLRTLRTFSSYLIKDVEKKDQTRILEDVQFIDDAASRMSHLIDDLLRLSRAGNQAIAKSFVNLNQCVENALEQLQALIDEKQAIVAVKPLPNIIGDSMQITSIFLNLINNGIKFHRDGIMPNLMIQPVSSELPDEVAISVTDNGIGIDSTHLEEIFGAFNKLHSPHQYAGTGIGLAIVKKIVERHGGRVEVTSILDEGSQFILYFPTPK